MRNVPVVERRGKPSNVHREREVLAAEVHE